MGADQGCGLRAEVNPPPGELGRENLGQNLGLLARTQRRQGDPRAGEQVVEVIAETPLRHSIQQRLAAEADDPQARRALGPLRLQLVEEPAQLGLRLGRHLGEVVEQHGHRPLRRVREKRQDPRLR